MYSRIFVISCLCVALFATSFVDSQHCARVSLDKDDVCSFFTQQFDSDSLFYVSDGSTIKDVVHQSRLRTEGKRSIKQNCSVTEEKTN